MGTEVAENIIMNHDFRQGLHLWHANNCIALIVSSKSGSTVGTSTSFTGGYSKVTGRKECWQGLEQDITSKVIPGLTYNVSAYVGVSGNHRSSNVQAMLKLEYKRSDAKYLFIKTIQVSEKWETLEGKFTLSTMPDRVLFFLEGPDPGVELLIQSVVISCSRPADSNNSISYYWYCATAVLLLLCHSLARRFLLYGAGSSNVLTIINPVFEDGLNNWTGRGCKVALHDSMADGKIVPQSASRKCRQTCSLKAASGILMLSSNLSNTQLVIHMTHSFCKYLLPPDPYLRITSRG